MNTITADELSRGDVLLLEDGTLFTVSETYWVLQDGRGVVKVYGDNLKTLEIVAVNEVNIEASA